jgi:excisionase family DNA binding protein
MVVVQMERQQRDLPLASEPFTVKQAATWAKVSTRTIWRWMKSGRLKYYQAGDRGSIRILPTDLQNVFEVKNAEATNHSHPALQQEEMDAIPTKNHPSPHTEGKPAREK